MTTVGAFHAKTHFSAILQDVRKGQTYIVTHRGEPIAEIVPLKKEPRITKLTPENIKQFKFKGGDANLSQNIDDIYNY